MASGALPLFAPALLLPPLTSRAQRSPVDGCGGVQRTALRDPWPPDGAVCLPHLSLRPSGKTYCWVSSSHSLFPGKTPTWKPCEWTRSVRVQASSVHLSKNCLVKSKAPTLPRRKLAGSLASRSATTPGAWCQPLLPSPEQAKRGRAGQCCVWQNARMLAMRGTWGGGEAGPSGAGGWVAAARAPCEGMGRCSVHCGRGWAWRAPASEAEPGSFDHDLGSFFWRLVPVARGKSGGSGYGRGACRARAWAGAVGVARTKRSLTLALELLELLHAVVGEQLAYCTAPERRTVQVTQLRWRQVKLGQLDCGQTLYSSASERAHVRGMAKEVEIHATRATVELDLVEEVALHLVHAVDQRAVRANVGSLLSQIM